MEQDINIIPELQEDIKLGEALKRLQKNKDFKALITEMYLDEGVKYLTTNIPVVRDREKAYEQITARGHLYRYLHEIESKALGAEQALAELEESEEE